MANAKIIKELPYISVEQMIEVDRLMIEEYNISLVQMMENAGRNLAELTLQRISLSIAKPKIMILAGSGGNGGGAMVAARHLSNKGFDVDIVFSNKIKNLKGVIKHQADILTKLPVNIFEEKLPINKYDVIIDGIIGYSLIGEPRGFAKKMILFCNKSSSVIISLDTPSGLNLDGEVSTNKTIVKADITMTLALPKIGLSTKVASKFVGNLFIADISVPPSLYSKMGLKVNQNLFAEGYVIKI